MITAVLLAGGRSRRSGRRHKACRRLPGERRSWVDRQIDSLRAAGAGRVVLVLGHQPRRVFACLHRRVMIVHNRRPARGPFASLQTALHVIRHHDALVSPLDAPLPPITQLKRLLRARHGADAAIAVGRDRRAGHPVLLSRGTVQRLKQLEPTASTARLDAQLQLMGPRRCRRVSLAVSSTRGNLNTERAWRDFVRRLPPQSR